MIVSSGCDDSSTRLLEYSVRNWVEVRNDGASGDVVFTAAVTEGTHEWVKTQRIHLSGMETQRMELVFDEPTVGGGVNRCRASVTSATVEIIRRLLQTM